MDGRPSSRSSDNVPAGIGVNGRFGPCRWIISGLYVIVFCLLAAPGASDTTDEVRIARCQQLVQRQSGAVTFRSPSWRVWADPVPANVLPKAALGHIKARDLVYDGGVGGLFTPKTASGQGPQVFAFCSYDNLFLWLQGIYDGGAWTQFGATDYIVPY